MNLKRITDNDVELRLTEDELRLMLGSLREVSEAVKDFEFYARVGAQKSDVHKACMELKQLMNAASIEL